MRRLAFITHTPTSNLRPPALKDSCNLFPNYRVLFCHGSPRQIANIAAASQKYCSLKTKLTRCVDRAVDLDQGMRGFVRSTAMEKHELSKIDFDLIEDAFKALLQSHPDPVTASKVADLRDMFRDAYTGWLEVEKEAA
jgi:hypothetical protein